ncbi:hypothetical protein PHYSODRAFT_327706 [Phytophthora sojae]|uniref:NADP-dependent oxidoreductase domain-containing protein n=1 Tax=Phytophthora sojae (strain P6497) TaxID=1094619 RepID=G4Z4Z8_PHYSP|nr:hypothetical protein PHYSODRAFT_327706 [Phytophthora sojae]EGZ19444.1 hypothetical protein PHYSODRAFT_327706 [Phytophthora sojae]|eukprot:XP_009522161.1 hypothetical protein PHYSODRAFT_327706 [Phytophthora sojae]
MSANVPIKTLPSGAKIPAVDSASYNAVLSALKLGYRHIDTAQYYENEEDVGRAIKDSGIPREEIFVTSKLSIFNWGEQREARLGHIDLYLLHAPAEPATRDETWRALEELQEQGILKDIGVSNFGEAHLEKLLKTAKFCKENGIQLEAYSPLARAQKMEDPTLLEVANEVNTSPAQVLVAFSLANGFVTLPKSVNPERQKTNLEAVSIKLTPAQIAKLAALDEYLALELLLRSSSFTLVHPVSRPGRAEHYCLESGRIGPNAPHFSRCFCTIRASNPPQTYLGYGNNITITRGISATSGPARYARIRADSDCGCDFLSSDF